MRLLTRLNAKTQSFDVAVKSFGSLSQSDVAAALKGLDPMEDILIRTKYVTGLRRPLQRAIELTLGSIKEAYRQGMAEALVQELVGTNTCKRCFGRGQIMRNKAPVDCPVCEGSGKKPPSYSSIAEKCGIKRQNFMRDYKAIYLKLLLNFHAIEGRALEKIRRNLT